MKTTLPSRSPLRRLLPSGLLIIGALAAHMPTAAFVVTNSADSGDGSLRQAISTYEPVINISTGLKCLAVSLRSELVIGHNLTINGIGAAFFSLNGNATNRVFRILPGASVTISNLTIINGGARGFAEGLGGGIYNQGILTVVDCAFWGNVSGFPSSSGFGGAIYSEGPLTLRNSSLTWNYAQGVGIAAGGAIYSAGPLLIVDCTLSENRAGGSGDASGGGIASFTNLSVINCTIVSNSVFPPGPGFASKGGGLFTANTTLSTNALVNTIIACNFAANGGPDVYGVVVSQGHNFIGITNDSTGWIPADLYLGRTDDPRDPFLLPLRYNGGQTLCHALRSDLSKAIDQGDNIVTDKKGLNLTTDQRGVQLDVTYLRKVGAGVDIGAFESGNPTKYTVFGCVAEPEFPHSLREILAEISNGDKMSFSPDIIGTCFADGELVIDKSIDIVGPGAAVLTLSGDGSNRVFHVTSNATVNISGLTIANGIGTSGGGILNEGTLQVSDCLIASNQASSFGGFGGGIYSSGTLTVSGSTFLSNNAAFGGGLANAGVLSVFNSTFASNSAVSKGGALFQFGSSALLRNCTVAGNAAFDGGGGLGCDIGSALPDVQNCLVAGNIGFVPDAYGIFNSLGYNLIGLADPSYTVGFGTNDDQLGTPSSPIDALLGSLQDNGGPTPTMALLPDSPAINRGYSPSLLLDQRGGHRPVYATLKLAAGDGSDIGAYERDGLLRITAIDRLAPTGINLSFWSELGSSYGIEQSPTLWPGSWTSLTDNVVGAGGVVQVADPDSMQPRRFYRVRLLP